MRFLLVISVLIAASSASPAKDVFVDNVAGDNRRDGLAVRLEGTSGGPCRTIGRALRIAGNGDRIILAKTDEPYRESITFQAEHNSGVAERPFMLIGNGAVLDGTQVVAPRAWEAVGDNEFRFRPRNLNHHLLYLDGKPAERRPAERTAPRPPLQARQWCTWDNYVFFRIEPDRIVQDYRLEFTALPVGITLYEVQHVVIRDLTIQGFQLDGINAHDDAVNVSLVGITSSGNGRSGISVGGSSRVQIHSCAVGNNGKAQVRTEGQSQTQIIDSQLNDNTAPALVRDGGLVTRIPNPAAKR